MAAVRVAEIAGRGRGWVAARAIKGGEVLLRESPILLYDGTSEDEVRNHCGHCFRSMGGQSGVECQGSCNRVFCGPQCAKVASSSTHSDWVCQALSHLRGRSGSLASEQLVEARFLVAAYNLARVYPAEFERINALQGWGEGEGEKGWECLVEFDGWSREITRGLVGKERVNAFGVMEAPRGDGVRRVLGYGIYPQASMFNHDCLPNACRFDYYGDGNGGRPEMVVRAIHDISEGAEICLSYFPVNLDYRTRQARLKDEYGFGCTCDRCRVEAQWPVDDNDDEAVATMDDGDDDDVMNNDDDDDDDDDDDATMDEDEVEDGDDVFPHAYFFGRYMCSEPNCGGTLAPLPPSNQSCQQLLTMECNVCARLSPLQS